MAAFEAKKTNYNYVKDEKIELTEEMKLDIESIIGDKSKPKK